jgi:hypothetical protein
VGVIETVSWEDFEEQLETHACRPSVDGSPSLLFRGLRDSEYKLETKLERAGQCGMRMSGYHGLISRVQPVIESITGKRWQIPSFGEVEQSLKPYYSWASGKFPDSETYSYMAYLRHLGFPSPLLDWTRSKYVAAFFAFRSPEKPKADKVSICAFAPGPGGMHDSRGKVQIRDMGPYVATHARHFLQQSDYTICAMFSDSEWCFAEHEHLLFPAAETDGPIPTGPITGSQQEVFWKFNIPWTERAIVLRMLDEYNLNAFSLFGSEEALMETTARRAFESLKLSTNAL